MATNTIVIPEIINLISNLATLNLGYLGIAVTILVFLGGAFYLFNFKPLKDNLEKQEKTIDGLKKEVEENLSSSKKEIKEELEEYKKNQDGVVLNLVTQRDDKLLADVQTKIAIFEKEFTQKFDSFVDEKDKNSKTVILAEVSDKIRELEKSLTTIVSSVKTENDKKNTNTEKSFSSLQNDFKELKRCNRKLEVFMYSQKGQMGAIYGSIDLLKDAIDENSWRIDSTLEDLNNEIKGIKLRGDIITRIEEQIVRLNDKPKYLPLVTKLRKHYQV